MKANTNPSPEEIGQLVLKVREEGTKPKLVEELGGQREAFRLEEAMQFLKENDNEAGYGGYDASGDTTCFGIMEQMGYSPAPYDIMVMPGSQGMNAQSNRSNTAVAIMSEEQVQQFKGIAMTNYGPKIFPSKDKMPCFGKLLDRIRVGTILISKELLSDEFKLKGTIWHECGHKYLNQPLEAGAVFVQEVGLMRKVFGKESARKWAMEIARTPGYHRTTGLATDPGRKDFLLLLQDICSPQEFYKEFAEQYSDIMGVKLEVPSGYIEATQEEGKKEEKKEKQPESSSAIGLNSMIKGTLRELKTQVPPDDLKGGTRGSVRPGAAAKGDIVKFAGRKWTVLDKQDDGQTIAWVLECCALSDVDESEFTGPVQSGSVWKFKTENGIKYGLTAQGPWVYTDEAVAIKEYNIFITVQKKLRTLYPEANDNVTVPMIIEYLEKTRGN